MQTTNLAQPKHESIALTKLRLLIVDDSRVMRAGCRRILAEEFDLVEAENGAAAWQMLTGDHLIQVVFTDLSMPNRNGFQLLRDIRESVHARINQLPVIVITGHEDNEEMKRRALKLGATDFIAKPFDSVQLLSRARVWVQTGDLGRQLAQAQRTLAETSAVDTLTSLASAAFFKTKSNELVTAALCAGTDLGLIELEVDNFESLRQKIGQQAEDKVLVHLGKALNACLRPQDVVARLQDAHFAVAMPEIDSASSKAVAEHIRHTIAKARYRLGQASFQLSVSIGLASLIQDGANHFEALEDQASMRLKQALTAGGNQLITSSSDALHQSITLDQAAALAKVGRLELSQNELAHLMARLYPLLVIGNTQLKLNLEAGLQALQARLQRV